MSFIVGDDRFAIREVLLGNGQKRVIKRLKSKMGSNWLKSRMTSKKRKLQEMRYTLDLNVLKDYVEMFGDQ